MKIQEKRSLVNFLKKLPFKLILLVGLFFGALALFGTITHEIFIEKEEDFDSRVIQFFAPYDATLFIKVMKVVTFFGSGKFLFPAYVIICLVLLLKRKALVSVHVAIIAISSTALSHGAKRVFQRARPDLPLIEDLKTYSFPSGHALSSFIFCTVVGYLVWKTKLPLQLKWIISILLLSFAMTIGLSRIVLKMHYPTDVLAGFLLGLVWVLMSFYILNKIWRKKSNSDLKPAEVTT